MTGFSAAKIEAIAQKVYDLRDSCPSSDHDKFWEELDRIAGRLSRLGAKVSRAENSQPSSRAAQIKSLMEDSGYSRAEAKVHDLFLNAVLEIQDKIRENDALIAQLEKGLSVHQSKSVAASLRSLYKLRHSYEEEFCAAAEVDFSRCGALFSHAGSQRRVAMETIKILPSRLAKEFAENSLGNSVICEDCRATFITYGRVCSVDLGNACPGYLAIERALDAFAAISKEKVKQMETIKLYQGTKTDRKVTDMKTDWIATFPAIFQESHRSVLETIEKAGFERGLQKASQIAASYSLECPDTDSICREIAREIAAQGWR